jgi:predicted lipid-binding transport protein (Tim44 family)
VVSAVIFIVAVACSPAAPAPATSAVPDASVGATASAANPSGASASAPAPSDASSSSGICGNVARMRAALAEFKAIDPSAGPTADLREAARVIGEAGAQLIVMSAGAADLVKLNHESILILGIIDAGQVPLPKDITEFETTTQKVLDELSNCS